MHSGTGHLQAGRLAARGVFGLARMGRGTAEGWHQASAVREVRTLADAARTEWPDDAMDGAEPQKAGGTDRADMQQVRSP